MKAVFEWDLELKAVNIINHQANRQFKVPIMSRIILGTVNIISDEIPLCLSQHKLTTGFCLFCVHESLLSFSIWIFLVHLKQTHI